MTTILDLRNGAIAVLLAIIAMGCATTLEDVRAMGRDADTDSLGDLLNDEHPESIQVAACEELGRVGNEEASLALRRALDSEVPKVRKAALKGWSQCKQSPAMDDLIDLAARDTDAEIRQTAEELLALITRQHKTELLTRLEAPDYRDRALAARWLGTVPEPDVTTRLIQTARRDENGEVRRWAVISLGQLGDPAAKAVLHHLKWRDSDPEVNREAEQALARFDPPVFDIRVAVAPINDFTGEHRDELAREFAHVITAALKRDGVCRLIERAEIEQAMEELKMSHDDRFDETQAGELGNFLAAQQILYGSIQRDGQEYTVVVQRMNVETLEVLQSVTERAYRADLGLLKSRVADQVVRTFGGAW